MSIAASVLAGQTVVLRASADLKTWTPLSTNQMPAGGFAFEDAPPADAPRRFYDAVAP